MSGSPSIIPAVRAALTGPAGIITAATFPTSTTDTGTVTVSYGHPGDAMRDTVYVAGTVEWDQEWVTVGTPANPRDERFTLALGVLALSPGKTQQEAVERAFSWLAVVELLLRPIPQLSGLPAGAQMFAIDLKFRAATDLILDEGRGCQIDAGVRVHGRI